MAKFSTLPKDDIMAVDPRDQKFLVAFPTSDLSIEEIKRRNDAVINETIRKYEETRAQKAVAYDDAYGERADAVVTYLKSLDKGKSSNINRYFGKKMLARLRGEEIRQKLMAGMTFKNQKGDLIRI